MNWFRNRKTAQKLVLGFGLCLALALLVGVVAITRLAQENQITRGVVSDPLAGTQALAEIIDASRHLRTLEFQTTIETDAAAKAGFENDIQKALGQMQTGLSDYGSSIHDPTDQRNFDGLSSSWQLYLTMHETRLVPLYRSGRTQPALNLLNHEMRVQSHTFEGLIGTMVDWNQTRGAWYANQAAGAYSVGRSLTIGLLTLAVLLGSLAGWLITRYMANLADVLCGDPDATRSDHIADDAYVVVIGFGETQVDLCVDALVGEQEVVIKSLGTLLGDIAGLAGATILGDGRVALIVDVAKAIESTRDAAPRDALVAA